MEAIPGDWQELINEGTYIWGLSQVANCKTSSSPHLPARILKVYVEALTRFSHIFSLDGFNSTLLSQGYVLGNGSGCGNSVPNILFKDNGGRGEPSIAWVQLTGQPGIVSSPWHLQQLSPLSAWPASSLLSRVCSNVTFSGRSTMTHFIQHHSCDFLPQHSYVPSLFYSSHFTYNILICYVFHCFIWLIACLLSVSM